MDRLCFFLPGVGYAFVCVSLFVPCGLLLRKGLHRLSFVWSNYEFDTFPLVSWVRCGT